MLTHPHRMATTTSLNDGDVRIVKLSPSSLSFDWDGCKACWWHFHAAPTKEKKVFQPFPKIFTIIDSAVKECFVGQVASTMMPVDDTSVDGRISGGVTLRSEPFVPKGCVTAIELGGRTDFIVTFDDGTYGVPDAKTSEVKPEHVEFYGRQLNAYAWCLVNPNLNRHVKGAPECPVEVSRLGLYYFTPGSFWVGDNRRAQLLGESCWTEVPVDLAGFETFMSQVGQVVDMPVAPPGNPDCQLCQLRSCSKA